jgi:hypothetical protein
MGGGALASASNAASSATSAGRGAARPGKAAGESSPGAEGAESLNPQPYPGSRFSAPPRRTKPREAGWGPRGHSGPQKRRRRLAATAGDLRPKGGSSTLGAVSRGAARHSVSLRRGGRGNPRGGNPRDVSRVAGRTLITVAVVEMIARVGATNLCAARRPYADWPIKTKFSCRSSPH